MSIDTYFCLCCLSTNDLTSVFTFDTEFTETSYETLLEELFAVKLSQGEHEDDNYICQTCKRRLRNAYKFKRQMSETLGVLQVNRLITIQNTEDQCLIKKFNVEDTDSEEKYNVNDKAKRSLEELLLTDTETDEDLSCSEDEFQSKNRGKLKKKCNYMKNPVDIATTIAKLREESLLNPFFQQVHDALPPMKHDYIVTQCTKSHDGEQWEATIRVNMYDKESAMQWLKSYTKVSNCDFRVRCAKKENSKRLVFKRDYRCQFNRYTREPKPSKRVAEGKKPMKRKDCNTNCPAIIRITIKQKSMKWSTDDLLEEYPCEIVVRHNHNHPILAPDVLKHRRVSPEVKEKFLKMFAAGHTPKSALELHKSDLLAEYGQEEYSNAVADGSKCPSKFWVYKLYRKKGLSNTTS